jgi:hypothetical protein
MVDMGRPNGISSVVSVGDSEHGFLLWSQHKIKADAVLS